MAGLMQPLLVSPFPGPPRTAGLMSPFFASPAHCHALVSCWAALVWPPPCSPASRCSPASLKPLGNVGASCAWHNSALLPFRPPRTWGFAPCRVWCIPRCDAGVASSVAVWVAMDWGRRKSGACGSPGSPPRLAPRPTHAPGAACLLRPSPSVKQHRKHLQKYSALRLAHPFPGHPVRRGLRHRGLHCLAPSLCLPASQHPLPFSTSRHPSALAELLQPLQVPRVCMFVVQHPPHHTLNSVQAPPGKANIKHPYPTAGVPNAGRCEDRYTIRAVRGLGW